MKKFRQNKRYRFIFVIDIRRQLYCLLNQQSTILRNTHQLPGHRSRRNPAARQA